MISKIIYNASAFLALLAIIFFSLTSRPVSVSLSNMDKVQHVLAYAVLSFFTVLSLGFWRVGKKKYIMTLLFCALVGGSLEILQSRFGRMMEFGDFSADLAGAALGCIAVRFFF